jgi:hypothetical protein
MVRCIVIMKAYHRPLTDILETWLCSGLLKTSQCTGTYRTYFILLEIVLFLTQNSTAIQS